MNMGLFEACDLVCWRHVTEATAFPQLASSPLRVHLALLPVLVLQLHRDVPGPADLHLVIAHVHVHRPSSDGLLLGLLHALATSTSSRRPCPAGPSSRRAWRRSPSPASGPCPSNRRRRSSALCVFYLRHLCPVLCRVLHAGVRPVLLRHVIFLNGVRVIAFLAHAVHHLHGLGLLDIPQSSASCLHFPTASICSSFCSSSAPTSTLSFLAGLLDDVSALSLRLLSALALDRFSSPYRSCDSTPLKGGISRSPNGTAGASHTAVRYAILV